MNARKFFGYTSREVLGKVRQALGEDALIVSNRAHAGGIEIMAIPAAGQSEAAAADTQSADGMPQLMREMGAMKSLLQHELSGMAWLNLKQRSPARAEMMQSLLATGFSAVLARELTGAVEEQGSIAQARTAVSAELERRLPLLAREALVEDGGVYALVGPTGVGKTTTIAKLAARCVVRNGAQGLALLTTDSYRIAAQDQLRIYGTILEVPVHAIRDAADLKSTLELLRDKHTILIDTLGMSQRDPRVREHQELLAQGGGVKQLLLLNATANAATLDEVVGAYAQGGVHGCIITKLDEAAGVATALDVAIRHKLTVNYVTDGQRVPEDLHLPNRSYLLASATQPISDTATHGLRPEEYGLVMRAAEQRAAYV